MAGPIYRANPPLWQLVIKIGLTMGVTMYLTKWMVKLMEPMIDPNYKQKQDAARARKSLMQRLGAAAHPSESSQGPTPSPNQTSAPPGPHCRPRVRVVSAPLGGRRVSDKEGGGDG
jgi:hypothetical protein